MKFCIAATCALAFAAGAFAQIPGLSLDPAPPATGDPDEEASPFFVIQQQERDAARTRAQSVSARFPRDKGSDRSAGQMFSGFFTEMFSSIRFRPRPPETWAKIAVEPEEFSVDERREVTVRYWVVNNARRAEMLEFPTTQRIEILVRDGAGNVIERWSDDRPFQDSEGKVLVNPEERIEYVERISTRDMVAGQAYTVEAWLVTNPEFGRTTEIRPTGNPPSVPEAPAAPGT